MANNTAGNETELLPPNQLVVLRNLSWLSLIALTVPFVAILTPGIAAFLSDDPNVLTALINLSWVLVIFGGFAFLVVSLFSAAVLFRVFNMHDKNHSLGLPRNSIRSLLTFLIFLILMAFIFYSTQVVSTQNSTGVALIPYDGNDTALLDETISSLGISGVVTGYEIIEEGGSQHARVTFLVAEESAAMEYYDRILIALLGISSTIIGFYFGTRSQESADDPKNDPLDATDENSEGLAPADPITADETDSLEWSVASSVLELSKAPDGGLTGIVIVNAPDTEGDREFGAMLVPNKEHDTAIEAAHVDVKRLADRLTLHVTGIDAAKISDLGLEMSVFYRDEEEQAKTLPVKIEATTP